MDENTAEAFSESSNASHLGPVDEQFFGLLSSACGQAAGSFRRDTLRSRFLIFVFGSIFGLALSVAHSTSPDDPVLGTWKLNVEKSKFVPGPGWQSQIRVYQSTPAGILVTWTGLDAKGEKMQVSYTYKYDGRDYPMAGSGSYDTLNAVRVDALTVKSEEKRNAKTVGIAVRTVSRDRKVLTITDEGTNRKGQAFSQVLVFDRQ
ncbi:MAG: hypothetical protein JSR66_26720 [Proteobacteria bacterium]|nr:hypothetical protein [Pseudomonadota bacterium]